MQVSAEMQGVSVAGMLVWSIHRSFDGPFKCYQYFGENLNTQNGIEDINNQIKDVAISVIRDKIANLGLNQILKNRGSIRNGVKEEIQKILSGWGIWLETCEIQDVKVCSSTIFENMQAEFNIKSKQKSEKIKAETQEKIDIDNLNRNSEY